MYRECGDPSVVRGLRERAKGFPLKKVFNRAYVSMVYNNTNLWCFLVILVTP